MCTAASSTCRVLYCAPGVHIIAEWRRGGVPDLATGDDDSAKRKLITSSYFSCVISQNLLAVEWMSVTLGAYV